MPCSISTTGWRRVSLPSRRRVEPDGSTVLRLDGGPEPSGLAESEGSSRPEGSPGLSSRAPSPHRAHRHECRAYGHAHGDAQCHGGPWPTGYEALSFLHDAAGDGIQRLADHIHLLLRRRYISAQLDSQGGHGVTTLVAERLQELF